MATDLQTQGPVMLTQGEVATMLRIVKPTLRRWRREGRFIQPDVKVGKVLLWRLETVERWIDAQAASVN